MIGAAVGAAGVARLLAGVVNDVLAVAGVAIGAAAVAVVALGIRRAALSASVLSRRVVIRTGITAAAIPAASWPLAAALGLPLWVPVVALSGVVITGGLLAVVVAGTVEAKRVERAYARQRRAVTAAPAVPDPLSRVPARSRVVALGGHRRALTAGREGVTAADVLSGRVVAPAPAERGRR